MAGGSAGREGQPGHKNAGKREREGRAGQGRLENKLAACLAGPSQSRARLHMAT